MNPTNLPPPEHPTTCRDANAQRTIRCIVAAHNAGGEPDLYFCLVRCTEQQYENGDHYDRAKLAAKDDGYGSVAVVFDENDRAGKPMLDLFHWKSAGNPLECT